MSARKSSPIGKLALIACAVLFCALTAVVTATWNAAAPSESFDLVIANGRVMDPESGLDANRNIGLRAGKIVAISEKALSGKTDHRHKRL